MTIRGVSDKDGAPLFYELARKKMSFLRVENITKSFDERLIIEDISFEIEEGETVAVLGVSGGGKTTLFNCISGLLAPDGGRIIFKNEDVTARPGHFSYMLQKDLLLEHKKIIDNVALPLILSGMKKKEARKKVEPYFKDFGLEGTQFLYPKALSGGMRQRAAFLRTYVASSGMILLDEPFSALDTITKSAMHGWFKEMAKEFKLTTLFITHDIDEALTLADRVFILKDSPGHLVKEITVDRQGHTPEDFKLTESFLIYKKEILEAL